MKVSSMKWLLALMLSGLSFAVAAQQQLKVGYVDSGRVLREADVSKRAYARLKAEFDKHQKDLSDQKARLDAAADKLDKDSPTLSDAEKQRRQRELVDLERDLQRKQREWQEDLNQRQNEETASAIERATRIIKQIGDAEHYDLIISDQVAIYSSSRVDITQKVIDTMNASSSDKK